MIKRLSSLLKNKDIDRLIKNFLSLSFLKLVNAVLPFVTLPYLLRVLGAYHYGAIILALSLVAYFQAITDYGFNLSATREISKHRSSTKQLSYIYSKTITSKLYLLIGSLLILAPIILLVPQFKEDLTVYLLMLLMLIGNTLFPEWFFRGVEEMGYIAILNLIIKLSFTIGVFILIKQPEDYWRYPLLLSVSFIIVSIYSHYLILTKFKLEIYYVNKLRILKNLKTGFPLFLNQFMPTLFNNTTNFLVGMILGKTSAGYFGATRQVVQFLTVFNSVVSTVFFPFLIRNKNSFNKFKNIYLSVMLIFAVFIMLVHKQIFKIIGINYNNDFIVLSVLVLGFVSIAIYSVFSTNFLIARGHDKVVLKVTATASIVGLLLSFPLISNYDLIGASLNIFISQTILALGAYYYYLKTSKEKIYEIKGKF